LAFKDISWDTCLLKVIGHPFSHGLSHLKVVSLIIANYTLGGTLHTEVKDRNTGLGKLVYHRSCRPAIYGVNQNSIWLGNYQVFEHGQLCRHIQIGVM